jgi:hypothetical protein
MHDHVFWSFKETVCGVTGREPFYTQANRDRVEGQRNGVQRIETLTVYVTDNRLCKAMACKCHEHLCCTFPPHHIVLWTPTCDGREEQCEVIFTCQFFCRSSMTAQSYQHLDTKFTSSDEYPTSK